MNRRWVLKYQTVWAFSIVLTHSGAYYYNEILLLIVDDKDGDDGEITTNQGQFLLFSTRTPPRGA